MNIRHNYPLRFFFIITGLLILSGILIQLLGFLSMQSGIIPKNPSQFDGFHIFLMILIQAFSFLVTFTIASRYMPRAIFLQWKMFQWSNLFHIFSLYLLLMIFLGLGQYILNQAGYELQQFEMLNKQKILEKPYSFIIAVSFVAPLYEEIIFRGFILSALWPLKGKAIAVRKGIAIFFSSFAFTLMHFESIDNLMILLPIFFLSLFLSYSTIRSGSLTIPVMIHIFQNTLSSVAFFST